MKRTPLKRKTPLKRGGRLQSVSAKRKAEQGDRDECRRLVMARAAGRCEVCPRIADVDPVTASECYRTASDVHEIKTRARGGSIFEPENCLAVCRKAHDWIHANPALATPLGLLASQW
jgi:hypothetical protein